MLAGHTALVPETDSIETTGKLIESAYVKHMRESRERLGISQAALVARLSDDYGISIDSTAVVKMEKGQRAIKFVEAAAIAQILGQDLNAMMRPDVSLEDQLADLKSKLQVTNDTLREATHMKTLLEKEIAGVEEEIARRDEQKSTVDRLKEAEREVERLRSQVIGGSDEGDR